MNDPHTPPQIPQPPAAGLPGGPTIPPQLPDAIAEEQASISNLVSAVEAILRQPRRVIFQVGRPGSGQLIAAMLLGALLCSLVYGVIVGTFSGGTQVWAAPLKVASGLLLSALICLPSLYIFSCLGGSQARLLEVVGLVAGLLLLMTVLLVGFAPVAWIFSQSTQSVAAMGALHLAFWFISTCFGIRFLNSGFAYRAGAGDGLKVWVAIFLLVMVQMTTALRPLVGTADDLLPVEKKFFVTHWIDSLKAGK
jgi:hypothetical protein